MFPDYIIISIIVFFFIIISLFQKKMRCFFIINFKTFKEKNFWVFVLIIPLIILVVLNLTIGINVSHNNIFDMIDKIIIKPLAEEILFRGIILGFFFWLFLIKKIVKNKK